MKDKKPTSAAWKKCLEKACARSNICLEICSSSHAKSVVSLGLKVAAECCTIKDFNSVFIIRFRIRSSSFTWPSLKSFIVLFHLSWCPCVDSMCIVAFPFYHLPFWFKYFLHFQEVWLGYFWGLNSLGWVVKYHAVDNNTHYAVWRWILLLKYLCID